MARASSYYFYSTRHCWICFKETDDILKVPCRNSDLGSSWIGVPIHKSCNRKKIRKHVAFGVLVFAGWSLVLMILETLVWNYGHEIRPIYALCAGLPSWLYILSLGFSFIVGFRAFLKKSREYHGFLDTEIRLHTMPAD
jgi:hypothetical protein